MFREKSYSSLNSLCSLPFFNTLSQFLPVTTLCELEHFFYTSLWFCEYPCCHITWQWMLQFRHYSVVWIIDSHKCVKAGWPYVVSQLHFLMFTFLSWCVKYSLMKGGFVIKLSETQSEDFHFSEMPSFYNSPIFRFHWFLQELQCMLLMIPSFTFKITT